MTTWIVVFPELPYVKIDFNNFYGAVPALADALAHYDVYRTRLNECLKNHQAGTGK